MGEKFKVDLKEERSDAEFIVEFDKELEMTAGVKYYLLNGRSILGEITKGAGDKIYTITVPNDKDFEELLNKLQ